MGYFHISKFNTSLLKTVLQTLEMLPALRYANASRVSPPLVLSPGSIPLCTASRANPSLFYDTKTSFLALLSRSLLLPLESSFVCHILSSSIPVFVQVRRDLFVYMHYILRVLSIAPLQRLFFLFSTQNTKFSVDALSKRYIYLYLHHICPPTLDIR